MHWCGRLCLTYPLIRSVVAWNIGFVRWTALNLCVSVWVCDGGLLPGWRMCWSQRVCLHVCMYVCMHTWIHICMYWLYNKINKFITTSHEGCCKRLAIRLESVTKIPLQPFCSVHPGMKYKEAPTRLGSTPEWVSGQGKICISVSLVCLFAATISSLFFFFFYVSSLVLAMVLILFQYENSDLQMALKNFSQLSGWSSIFCPGLLLSSSGVTFHGPVYLYEEVVKVSFSLCESRIGERGGQYM